VNNVINVVESGATYNWTETTGSEDMYNMGKLPYSGALSQVSMTVRLARDFTESTAGPDSLVRLGLRLGSVDWWGDTETLTQEWKRYSKSWDTNPDTSAEWQAASVNAMQMGVFYAGGGQGRVDQLYSVCYVKETPTPTPVPTPTPSATPTPAPTTTPPGSVRVVLWPNDVGSNSGWTPVGFPDNFNNVNNIVPSPAIYNWSLTSTYYDMYGVDDIN